MKKIFFLLIIVPLINTQAQWDIGIAMGLDFKSSPSYRDYINSNFSSYGKELASFSSAVNFSGEVDYKFTNKFQFGIECSFLIDSYNAPIGLGGIYEISYVIYRPSLIAYYVYGGEGYKFKFGGGLGPRFISLTENNIVATDYKAEGFGLILKAEGNTLLSDKLYALIGFDLRFDSTNNLQNKSNNKKIINYYNGEAVNMTSLSVGVKLGVTYIF